MIIYKTTNLINGKIYVGQDNHNNPSYYGSGLLLNRAIKKYGKENFKKEILEECETKDILNEQEIFWIANLKSMDKNIGYNIARGGTGGDTMSNNPNKKIIFEKLSLKNKGRKMSESFCKRMSEIHKGKILTEEQKQKIKDNHADFKGEKHPSWGMKRSVETRKKIADANSRRVVSEETKRKISDGVKLQLLKRKLLK